MKIQKEMTSHEVEVFKKDFNRFIESTYLKMKVVETDRGLGRWVILTGRQKRLELNKEKLPRGKVIYNIFGLLFDPVK